MESIGKHPKASIGIGPRRMTRSHVASEGDASCSNTSCSESTSKIHAEQLVTPFLSKLYDILAESSNSSLVHWLDSGDCFEVKKPTEFAHQILPNYYKHNNFSSFVRQLNQYGFRKIDKERWLFQHPCFKRGKKELLGRIGRRKSNQRHKNKVERNQTTIMVKSEQETQCGIAVEDTFGDGNNSSQWKNSSEYVDRPLTGQDTWEWMYRELVSSKERQRKLSYLIQLDEHKLDFLEKQLCCMKQWMYDYTQRSTCK